jgi:hypothetical protein
MPHIDDFRPVHNLESLADLGGVLTAPGRRRMEGVSRWLEQRSP